MEEESFESIINAGDEGSQPSVDDALGLTPDAANESDDPISGNDDVSTGEDLLKGDGNDDAKSDDDKSDLSQDDEITDETEINDELIEKLINNQKSPKYFKNAIEFQKRKTTEFDSKLKPYLELGTPEDLQQAAELHKKLFGFAEKDGNFASTASEFALELLQTKPETALELINTLVAADSPFAEGKSIFEQMIDLPEVQEALKQKFQILDDPNIEFVPDEFKEAYSSLEQEFKEDFRYLTEGQRNAVLQKQQQILDKQKADDAFKLQQQQETQKRFSESVDKTIAETFDAVTDQFYESLGSIPFSADPTANSFLHTTIYDKILTATTMAETYGGQRAIKDLAQFGISVPEGTGQLVEKLKADGEKLARAAWQKNEQAVNFYKSEIITTQKQLVGKSNEISAMLAAAFGSINKKEAEKLGELIDDTKQRPTISDNGAGGNATDTTDYSNMSWKEIFS